MRPAGAVRPTFLNPKIGLGFASPISRRVSGRAAFCLAAFELTSFALTLSVALILALALVVVPSAAAQDDIASRRASAQDQFERAEAQRAALEAKAERERSLRDYEDLVSAYRRVYLITPNAVEVPPAIKKVADLYRRMGEQFEASYFRSAIKTYEFLIHDYPASSLREEAATGHRRYPQEKSFSVRPDPTRPGAARTTRISWSNIRIRPTRRRRARRWLKYRRPRKHLRRRKWPAPHARERAPLGTAGTAAGPARERAPELRGNWGSRSRSERCHNEQCRSVQRPQREAPRPAGTEPEQGSEVSRVRVWNADNYTRIIIELGGKAKYQAARISDPDRIYFDIDNAKLSSELLHAPDRGSFRRLLEGGARGAKPLGHGARGSGCGQGKGLFGI